MKSESFFDPLVIRANCLTLNDTEGRAEKAGVSNRCLIFDDTDGTIGITEYGEQKRVSGKDALAVWAGAWSPV